MTDYNTASPYLTLAEAAAYLRLHPRTLDNMRGRGVGPIYCKHGGRVVYHRDDLAAWSKSTRRHSSSEKARDHPADLPDRGDGDSCRPD